MYKKLKFFKMFLGTILMTLTLISVLKSCSYAYTIDEFFTLNEKVYQHVSSPSSYDEWFYYHTSVIRSNEQAIRNYFTQNNITNVATIVGSGPTGSGTSNRYTSYIYYKGSNNLNFVSQDNSSINFNSASFIMLIVNDGTVTRSSADGTSSFNKVYSWGLISFANETPTLTNCYYQNFLYLLNFVSVDNGTISVTNDVGTSFTVNRLPFNRTITSWKIGRITNISDEVVFIKGHFGPLISSDNGGNIFNTKYQFIWRKGARVESNGFTIASDGNVYINTQYLIPNQTYECWFLYSTDNVISYEFGQTMYYAYYSNTSPTNPSAISSDLNDDTDIGFINAFGDIVSPDKEDINNTIDNIFTNPYGSGEFFGITYDEDFDDWGFGTFIYNLIQGIITTFTSFNNVTMDFGVLGAINSSAFSIGNSYVGAFLSFFCNAILVITLIFWYYRLVKSFATLDLTTISKYDFDKMFNIF